MGFRVNLQDNKHVAGIESLAPDRLDRLPLPTAAGHFTRLGCESHFRRAFVARDKLDWQLKGGDQEFRGIVCRVARRDAAELYRGFSVSQSVERGDTARFVESASDVVLGRNADVFETTGVELDTRFAEDLVYDLVAVKVEDRQAIGLSDVVDMVGGDQTGGAGHIFHDDRRTAWNMFGQMARDQARVGIKATAGGETDDDSDRLAFVVGRGAVGGGNERGAKNGNKEKLYPRCRHGSLLFVLLSVFRSLLTPSCSSLSMVVEHFRAQLIFPSAAAVGRPLEPGITNPAGTGKVRKLGQRPSQDGLVARAVVGRAEGAPDRIIDKDGPGRRDSAHNVHGGADG